MTDRALLAVVLGLLLAALLVGLSVVLLDAFLSTATSGSNGGVSNPALSRERAGMAPQEGYLSTDATLARPVYPASARGERPAVRAEGREGR